MKTDKKPNNSADSKSDALITIDDIGPKFAEALYRVGIRRFADLAEYTPDRLAKELWEKLEYKVSPERIESKNWIGQAAVLAKKQEILSAEPPHESMADTSGTGELNWRQHAGFSVFFDFLVNAEGKQIWQTRVLTKVYHDESGDQEQFPGYDPKQWVEWIIKRAKLPEPEEAAPVHTDSPQSPSQEELPAVEIEIMDVQVSEIKSSSDSPRKQLAAIVSFQLAQNIVEQLTTNNTLYQTTINIINQETEAVDSVATEYGWLMPGVYDYKNQHLFPMPAAGEYELEYTILVSPPYEIQATLRGPLIEIKP